MRKLLLVNSLGLLICTGPAVADGPTGKLTEVVGPVFVTPPGASEAAARAGTAVTAGTRVRTGKEGSATVSFEDGSLLRVQPLSAVQLSGNKRPSRKNSLVLFFGRVWSRVTKAAEGET